MFNMFHQSAASKDDEDARIFLQKVFNKSVWCILCSCLKSRKSEDCQ